MDVIPEGEERNPHWKGPKSTLIGAANDLRKADLCTLAVDKASSPARNEAVFNLLTMLVQ
jgi:hypothetical protein